MTIFKGPTRIALERTVAEAIDRATHSEQLRRAAEERAARRDDLPGGLLRIHQPHAQAAGDGCQPNLFCTECASAWPCKTVQFVYRFGEFAPPAD